VPFVVCAAALLVGVPAATGQDGPARPELRPLTRYLGQWSYEGEDKTPVTGGRVTCQASRRWISGGYFVESHRTCKTPRGEFEQVEVFGYDFSSRRYIYWGFNGSVVSTYETSSMNGGPVVWVGLGASSGNRCTEEFAADAQSSTDKCESARGDGSWTLRSAGRYFLAAPAR
jgi:hypothetical protein